MIDVKQLCGTHIPTWLATRGMGVEKIAQFYDDPVKRTGDADSSRMAEYSLSFATSRGMIWRARRLRAYLQPRMRGMLRIARLNRPPSYVTRAAS
jgi:hypothetical protein